ncbi:hypothetical protein [Nocardiopsis sp. ATB16-24]|nr:hypothetical protein [Nocardiopsis sp. ATB16-24]
MRGPQGPATLDGHLAGIIADTEPYNTERGRMDENYDASGSED